MRKNYLAKLVNYTKKVLNIERSLSKLSDGRNNPKYKTKELVLIVLMGFLMRTRSFNNLNNMIKDDDFKNIIPRGMKAPKIDAIRDGLKVINISSLRGMMTFGIRKARENKVFEGGTIDGLVVTGIDGTQTFNSDKKSCEHCLKAFKKGKIEQRNFHSSVVLSTVGQGSKLVIDFEPYRTGIDKAKKDGYENIKVYEGNFDMDNIEKPLRFIKFLIKKPDGKRSQIMIVATCMEMELRTLFKIIRARQDIENSIFHNLKTECGLEHCFVHGGNGIEAVLCLMFIASNIFQLFYHRRIKKSLKTQVELVRQLLKGLYLLKRKPELIFNTG